MLGVKREVGQGRGQVSKVVAHLQGDIARRPESLLSDARDDERPPLREDTW